MLSKRDARKTVELAAGKMSERMARESIEREKCYIDEKHERTQAYAEAPIEPETFIGVVPKKEDEDDRDVEEISVQILENERKGGLTPVSMLPYLANSARWWIEKEGPIIGFPVIVAGRAKP